MFKFNPRIQKLFAGRVIGTPLIWAGTLNETVKQALDQFGKTPAALAALRQQGIDPDRVTTKTLVRVSVCNGEHLRKSKIVSISASLAQLCTEQINKGDPVMFVAEGIKRWQKPDAANNVKGDPAMRDGTPIHKPLNLVGDSFVLAADYSAPKAEAIPLPTRKPSRIRPEQELLVQCALDVFHTLLEDSVDETIVLAA